MGCGVPLMIVVPPVGGEPYMSRGGLPFEANLWHFLLQEFYGQTLAID